MAKTFTREEIRTELAGLYGPAYEKYQALSELAKLALQEGREDAYEANKRWAEDESFRLDGIQDAAGHLGVDLTGTGGEHEGR